MGQLIMEKVQLVFSFLIYNESHSTPTVHIQLTAFLPLSAFWAWTQGIYKSIKSQYYDHIFFFVILFINLYPSQIWHKKTIQFYVYLLLFSVEVLQCYNSELLLNSFYSIPHKTERVAFS